MNFKWVGPLALLAALVIGDQIRINRPGHKYRLTVEVETPEGVKSASGVMAVHPDRSYSRGGHTLTRGDAVLVDLGGVNYVALRAYNAAGRKASFNEMSRMTGAVPVKGALVPVLVTFTDLTDPGTAREVLPDEVEAGLGKGFHVGSISVEVVPNGLWPLDFGGPLGEPVTRGIEAKLPWWNAADNPAARALQAAGLQTGDAIDPKEVFTRKQ
jgi:hypothetical protein